MNNTKLAYLQNVPALAEHGQEFLYQIAEKSNLLTYRKGEMILHRGHPNQWIGIICQGLVKAYENMDNKEENFWAVFKEDDYCVCPFTFMKGSLSETNLEALENTTILTINLQDFAKIRAKYPRFEARVLQVLSHRMMVLMKEKSLLLNMTAVERYEYFLQSYPDMMQRLPLGHISKFLGIRQSSLSRIRRSLSQQRVQHN